jgi:hypothetical protein
LASMRGAAAKMNGAKARALAMQSVLVRSSILACFRYPQTSHSYSPQQIRSIGDRHHEQHGAHGDFIGVRQRVFSAK